MLLPQDPFRSAARAGAFAVVCLACATLAAAVNQPSVPPNDLVREAVSKELQHPGGVERFMYRMKKVTPEGSQTKAYVETDLGTVARLIALNDKPLSPELQAKENARLQSLLDNPALQRDRQKKQQEDEERVTKMVGALADAFDYEYDGTEPAKSGTAELVRLKFQPKPSYDPPTRELKVYQGMSGKMWIDSATHHMARIEAQLFRDVDFGWGILGRLYKGGHFDIEQSDVGGGRWETTYMNLDFTGKALLFKSLKIRDTQTLSEFHRLPAQVSLAQGIEILRNYDPNKREVVALQSPGAAGRSHSQR